MANCRILATLSSLISSSLALAAVPTALKVNHAVSPVGVEASPVFSWQLEAAPGETNVEQRAYRVWIEGGWDSGVVESGRSAAVTYGGEMLKDATLYDWRVAVRDGAGNWTTGAVARFSTGITATQLWQRAAFIAPAVTSAVNRTTAFAKRLELKGEVAAAWWFVSGCGVFEAYVNGQVLGPERLKPGYTHTDKRRHYYAYDVKALLRPGANVLAAEVSTGWWNDQMVARLRPSTFRALLLLRFADGSERVVPTDLSWQASCRGPVVAAGIYEGEDFDARIDRRWLTEGPGGASWQRVVAAHDIDPVMEAAPAGATVVAREDLALDFVSAWAYSGSQGAEGTNTWGDVIKVREYGPGATLELKGGETLVVDFGQNCAGVEDFTFTAAAGVELTVRHAEMLNEPGGDRRRGNDGPGGSIYDNLRRAKAMTRYVFAGAGEERYRPAFTFYGGRYLSIQATGAVKISALKFVPLSSLKGGEEPGVLTTGEPSVNQLLSNIRWSHRSNYLSIPSDCPQRDERMGWAADTWVFAPVACYHADAYHFLRKWMDDMNDCMTENDEYVFLAPNSRWGVMYTFGWSDAGVIVPHVLWRMYGDDTVVRRNYAAMRRYLKRLNVTDGYPLGTEAFTWGDHLALEGNRFGVTAKNVNLFLADAFWIWDLKQMAELGKALGQGLDVANCSIERKRAMTRFAAKYLDHDGVIKPEFANETTCAYAIYLKLVSGQGLEAAKRTLLGRLTIDGMRAKTGFLGTAVLMETLSLVGANSVAYDVLLGHGYPGWLYSVDQGATTTWERWNSYTRESGFGPVGMNSFNHYAYGVVEWWLWRRAAGIREDLERPGFKHFFLEPAMDARLGRLEAAFESPYGRIASRWEFVAPGKWKWTFEIPANTTATVKAPGRPAREYGSGTWTIER